MDRLVPPRPSPDERLDREGRPPVAEPVIVVDRLTKRFGEAAAVDDLSFSVPRGTVTGFLGPNGAGKSTTLRMLLGLATPTSGVATILGRPYTGLPDPLRVVGALLDPAMFHPGRTGRSSLYVTAVTAGIGRQRVDEVLELVDLSADAHRKVKTYSTGMKQRLGLANALLGDPQVLVLDEPANGLDPEGMRWLREFLRGQADDGRTVLVSSHVLAEVQQMADDVVIINRGRYVFQGPIERLGGLEGGRVVARSPMAEHLLAALQRHWAGARLLPTGEIVVTGATAGAVGDVAHDAHLPLHELRDDAPSLEELFLEVTR